MNANLNFIPGRRDPRVLKMREDIFEVMSAYAKSQRRPGETEAQAFRRLAVERDPVFMKQYELHDELREVL